MTLKGRILFSSVTFRNPLILVSDPQRAFSTYTAPVKGPQTYLDIASKPLRIEDTVRCVAVGSLTLSNATDTNLNWVFAKHISQNEQVSLN